jgi:hypothetical protein
MNFARIINLKLERNIFWHVEIRENKGLEWVVISLKLDI